MMLRLPFFNFFSILKIFPFFFVWSSWSPPFEVFTEVDSDSVGLKHRNFSSDVDPMVIEDLNVSSSKLFSDRQGVFVVQMVTFPRFVRAPGGFPVWI